MKTCPGCGRQVQDTRRNVKWHSNECREQFYRARFFSGRDTELKTEKTHQIQGQSGSKLGNLLLISG